MNAESVRALFAALAERFEAERERLASLDAALGDGDHGSAMVRGYSAAKAAVEGAPAGDNVGDLFGTAGRAFMTSVGGASGPLFASVWLAFGEAAAGADALDCDAAARAVAGACEKIARLGRVEPGDKTMLDALGPAGEALKEAAGSRVPLGEALRTAADAAASAAESTADLGAKKGRARHVEAQGLGHVDPGAVSVSIMLETMAEVARR